MTDCERPLPAGPRTWAWTTVGTPLGPLGLAATAHGLVNVVFHADDRNAARAVDRLTRHLGSAPGTPPSACHELLAEASAQLRAYFDGRLHVFSLPLDWSLTSGFNRRTLHELLDHVPYGTVVAYQDLADRVGEPGAARAVGVAMGSNPLPVVVPCHRVVESSGGLGGFGPGLEAKRTLLALEGVLPQPLF
ncbi:methylated-DNA--[protein]-cysteine S-methyltransferase [Streptomyces cinnamoneus]|uniref:methylated-DNA--[protein]-cysteine S-methyltransferase n=1 Tax=Streptomyces cinnamoneus TaxID=53446 RepID=UPI0033F7CC23